MVAVAGGHTFVAAPPAEAHQRCLTLGRSATPDRVTIFRICDELDNCLRWSCV
jgi:hypothetical protein